MPAAYGVAGQAEVCADPADAAGNAQVRPSKPGTAQEHDLNDLNVLTPAEAVRRTRQMDLSYVSRLGVAPLRVPQTTIIRIPVVVHVIQRDSSRAGGNISQSARLGDFPGGDARLVRRCGGAG